MSEDPQVLPPEDLPLAKPKRQASFARLSFEYGNPVSLVELLPEQLREKMARVPTEYQNKPAEDLELILPNPLGPTGERLRRALWSEYWRALDQRTKMSPEMIYGAVCSAQAFQTYLNDPRKLAWLSVPPESYTQEVEDLLDRGLRRVREILAMPLYIGNQPNTRVAEVILKAVMMLDLRAKGGHTQRVESKNYTLHQELPASEQPPPKNIEEMNARIKLLEQKIQEAQGALPSPDAELVGMRAALTVETVGVKHSGKKKNPKAGG